MGGRGTADCSRRSSSTGQDLRQPGAARGRSAQRRRPSRRRWLWRQHRAGPRSSMPSRPRPEPPRRCRRARRARLHIARARGRRAGCRDEDVRVDQQHVPAGSGASASLRQASSSRSRWTSAGRVSPEAPMPNKLRRSVRRCVSALPRTSPPLWVLAPAHRPRIGTDDLKRRPSRGHGGRPRWPGPG